MENEIRELITEISQELDLGEIKKLEEIPHRVYPQKIRFIAETNKGKFFFKFYENGLIKDYIPFLKFLNLNNFPTPELISEKPLFSREGIPFLVYSFLEGQTKSFLKNKEIEGASKLIARLHQESDNFYGKFFPQEFGLTHGDLKLQNLIFDCDNSPNLIDFERMKLRNYHSDIANFLFFTTLSDIYKKYTSFSESKMRKDLFIEGYEGYRKIKLDKEELSKNIYKKKDWFVEWVNKQLEERSLSQDEELTIKRELTNIICEVLI